MLYIISPFKTLTNSILASFIFNAEYPTSEIHNEIQPEEKDGKYIYRSHTDYGLIEKIFNKEEDSTIITIIRDPVSQYISGFFQDIDCQPINLGTKEEIMNLSLDTIIDTFNDVDFLSTETYNIDILFDFYKKIMNFNIYNRSDNYKYFTQGYNYYDIKNQYGNTIRLIVIRSDKINDCFRKIGEMFNINDIKLYNSNTAQEHWYKKLYKDFKDKVLNEKRVKNIDKYMDLKYVNYFYSEEEKEQLRNLKF